MTAAEIQTQFTDSPCVANLVSGQLDWLKVILLWKIANGDVPMTASDIQTLLDESPCVANLTSGQLQWLQVILLSEIGGISPGGATVIIGSGEPDPGEGSVGDLYWDDVGKNLYVKDADGWNIH